MTRVNSGIHPRFLTRLHLLAEHREIKRIPNVIKSGRFKMDKQPKDFTLGTGHVKFYYNKLHYLYQRYQLIYQECIRRKYKVEDYSDAWSDLQNTQYWNNWDETIEAHDLIRDRINERLLLPQSRINKWFTENEIVEPELLKT